MLREEGLTHEIIGAAIEVHSFWGPGLYEEIYERSMMYELRLRNINAVNQLSIPLIYKGERVGDDLKVDVYVENKIVVELKAVTKLLPVHEGQLLTYMRLLKAPVGLLVNFNEAVVRQGVRRLVI